MKKIILLLSVILISIQVISQTIFQKTLPYASISNIGQAARIENTNDGGYVLLRIDLDNILNRACSRLIKTNTLGQIEWSSTIYLDSADYTSLMSGCVKQTNDKGYILTGYSSRSNGDHDMFLIKTDSIGNLLWNKYYCSLVYGERERPSEVIQTTDGGYLIIGTRYYVDNTSHLWLIKTNATGIVTWEKVIYPNTSSTSFGCSIHETSNGDFLVLGKNTFYPFLTKINSSGNTIWGKIYPNYTTNDFVWGSKTNDGGFIIQTTSNSLKSLIKVNANGDVSWFTRYNVYIWNSIQQTHDNGYVTCGNDNQFGTSQGAGFILKTDSLGNFSFLKTISGSNSIFKSVKQTTDHGYAIAGDRYVLSNAEMFFVKTDSLGFSGCNNLSGTPIVSQFSLTATTATVIILPSNTYSTGALPLNYFIDVDTTTTNLCSSQGYIEIDEQYLLKIFPNPTKDEFSIQINENSKNSKLKLINIVGETILEKDITLNEEKINISDQPSGVYLIELNQHGNISRKKIIKE